MKKYSENRNLFIHDYFQNFGGGERLILSLVRKTDVLVTSFKIKKIQNYLIKKKVYCLQSNEKRGIYLKKFLTPFSFFLFKPKYKYLNTFVSGNYSVFSNLSDVKNKILYCHSLPKVFFNYDKFYINRNFFFKFVLKFISIIFKKIYLQKLNKFDYLIANSKFTKKKMKKYINKKIHVVYPPIEKFYSKKKN